MTINLRGQLVEMSHPLVMGILNITPDSFYAESRTTTDDSILHRAGQMIADGADIIDVGACSTRPNSTPVESNEEMRRLNDALTLLRRHYPDAILSVDTFRADVAERCVKDFGVDIINDIGGGELDKDMFSTVADLRVPYVLTHNTPLSESTTFVEDACLWLAKRIEKLRLLGVADVIVDPGFGFGKTIEQNYALLHRLSELSVLSAPILVGVSRKSMIWKALECTPADALNGTTVLNTIALQAGASILRVHDVRAAKEAIHLWQLTTDN